MSYPEIDRAVACWRSQGVKLSPPAPEDEVVRVFASLGVPLSEDVRRLYAAADGFVDDDAHVLWSFWPLRRVAEENGGYSRPFVLFADWLIFSHMYCFEYNDEGTSSVYLAHVGNEREPDPIAQSVEEFLRRLVDDPDSVWAWNPGGF